MASRIQIARGQLPAFLEQNQLAEGELFWQSKNNSNNSENDYKDDINRAWDEGTLFIGRPTLKRDAADNPIPETPIAIGGTRTIKSLVYRGKLTDQKDTNDGTFRYARVGDFYIFANDAVDGSFKTDIDFRKDDILLVVQAPFDDITGVTKQESIVIEKIDCSGGNAYQTRFDNTNTNFESTNVQDALEELEYEKLKYIGSIGTQDQFTHLGTDGNDLSKEIGGLYLLTGDNIVVSPLSKNSHYNVTRPLKKGDFIFYINEQEGWGVIPSGYTDAQDIDYDRDLALQNIIDTKTFNDTHIKDVEKLTNVKEALDFLISKKAQLDDYGKVPLSQLHDTVLGAMQYMGTWDPLLNGNLDGVTDPNLQTPWPTGRHSDSEEGDGIHSGDYYIVKTSGRNIRYQDKDSWKDGKYNRVLELNNGDWIVYSKEPVPDLISGGEYNWSVIDNTDRITELNFTINGEHSTGEALPMPEVNKSVIGSPSIGASDKLVLWDNAGKMTVAGVRLVSQKLKDNGKHNVIPRYSDESVNSLENSNIYNYDNFEEKGPLTLFKSNVSVGDAMNTFHTEVHGNISLHPQISVADGKAYTDSHIEFIAPKEPGTALVTTELKNMFVKVNPYFEDNAQIFLPDSSSTIIGKLKGVTLISGRITKVDQDGYIKNSTIEEYLNSEGEVDNVHIHAPTLSVTNTEVKHIVFGEKNSTNWVDGHHPSDEKQVDFWASEKQVDQRIQIYLPAESGTLITDANFDNLVKGDEHILPVFGPEREINGNKRSSLINSNIEQTANALFNTIIKTASTLEENDKLLLNLKYDERTAILGEDGLPVKNEDGSIQRELDKYDSEDTVVRSNLIVGKLSQDEYGKKYISEEDKKNVLVTGDFIMGNPGTNTTFLHPDRTFKSDTQYRNIYTGEELPLSEVHLDMPSISGVLLTSNSRLDGGFWA